jgi:outer membrane protein OmpA-like peptidoglycan-associated protein
MKFLSLHASLMGLALVGAAPLALADQTELRLAQAETEVAAPDLEQIRKFLAGGRDLARLDEERLQQRLNRAKRLTRTEGLPPDLAEELDKEIAALTSEIERRQQAAAEPTPPPAAEQPEVQPQPEAQPEPQPEQQAQPEPEPQQQAQPEPEPQPQPEPQQAEQAQQEQQPPAQPEAAAPEAANEVTQFLQSVRPAAQLTEDEIRQQMRRATELARSESLAPDQRQALREVIREARTALRSEGGNDAAETQTPPAAPETQTPPAPQEQAQQPEPQPQQPAAEQPPAVDPALERQARAILEDNADVSTMSRRELRQRLSGIRDLLASGQLSPETREALRKKLAAERQVLRREVSQEEGSGNPPAQGTGGTTSNNNANTTVNNNTNVNTNVNTTDVRVVLEDRRPPAALDEDELIRRIDIYREVVRDQRYDDAEREAWRRALERDRRYLRRQMLEDRQTRAERLRRGDFEYDIEIEEEYDPRFDVPDDVFAAEVDDEELADVLAAPPRRKVERRYTVEEIERTPAARNAVARIEIDTVNFGFGEGFLREEEIDKLDRIAQVLERILAKNPDEVFLLEGHTDAVGSAASNLKLSRERALAVKEALTTYYVIPEENLKTVGLGERYLKIPTLQAEAENRRVSLARITSLIGRSD